MSKFRKIKAFLEKHHLHLLFEIKINNHATNESIIANHSFILLTLLFLCTTPQFR